jgi:hypothetical protein
MIERLLGRRSRLLTESKLLLYKAVLKPNMDLWNSAREGATSNSNIETLQRFQSNTLRSILNDPWYINNHRIHEDLQINTVLSEIKKLEYQTLKKIRKPH